MSYGLVISSKNTINDLYSVNLRAYVNANVAVTTDIHHGLKVIEMTPNLDFIICESVIGDDDGVKLVTEKIYELGLSIPILFIGQSKSITDSASYIKDPFDIKEVIKRTARILEITAQDMIKLPVPELFPIPIGIFLSQTTSCCDAYHRASKAPGKVEYIKIINQGESLRSKMKSYQEEEIDKIYVPSEYRLRVTNVATTQVLARLNTEPQSDNERLENTEQAMNLFANMLGSVDAEVAEEIRDLSESCVKNVQTLVENIPNLGKLTNLLLKHRSNYIYTHGVLAHYVSSHIISHSSWGNQEQIDKVGLVLFYHDIYLVPLYAKRAGRTITEQELLEDGLSPEETKILQQHAYMAASLVQKIKKIPHGADSIIMQHHGIKNGVGFTENYPDDISALSKVVIISEAFAEQFLTQTDKNGQFNLDDTLAYLTSVFKRNSYRNLIESLKGIRV